MVCTMRIDEKLHRRKYLAYNSHLCFTFAFVVQVIRANIQCPLHIHHKIAKGEIMLQLMLREHSGERPLSILGKSV